MKLIRSFLAVILAAVICFPAAAACAEPPPADDDVPVPNTEYRPDLYPYVVHGTSADLYIAGADIEEFGLETLCEGLARTMEILELDFADARAALAPYLADDIPVIRICTDFCNHADRSRNDDAYYNRTGKFIKVFNDWDSAKWYMLHEYTHYLTMTCSKEPIRFSFWEEGIAEYISRFVCRNRLARSSNSSVSDAQLDAFRRSGLIDPVDGLLNIKRFYLLHAEGFVRGYALGIRYSSASNKIIERTEAIQQDPKPEQVSYYEAGSMTAWLCETWGEDYVFSHWSSDPEQMEKLFGRSFRELYREWTGWNTQQCEQEGIIITDPAA